MTRSLVVLIIGALLFAGCADDGDDVDPESGRSADGDNAIEGNETQEAIATGQEPASWEVGYYWSYRTSFGEDFTLVVSEDRGDDWFLDTPDEDTAWADVREPISYLGEVRKDDLAGSQGAERVQYFDFPLEEGNEWTTQWDGVERRVVTVEADESFRFEAYEEDRLAIAYDYDPEVGWFTKVTFYEGEDEEESVSFEINDHQTAWTGEVIRWDAQNHVDWEIQGQVFEMMDLEEGHQELWTRIWARCDVQSAVFTLQLVPVDNPNQDMITSAGGCMDEEEIVVFTDPEPGLWMVTASGIAIDPNNSDESAGHFAVEIWSRNLETLTVA